MARRAFIVGGTGQIGRAVASALLDEGWRVTLSSRGGRPLPVELVRRGAELVTLDRAVPGALARALGGADALIDTIAYDDKDADQLIEVGSDVGAVVVISSASVYRDGRGRTLNAADEAGFPDFPTPIRETQATVEPGPETYSTRKVALEQRLLDRAGPPVTVLRPCAVHGPWSEHPREWWFVKRMLDGRAVIPLAFGGRSRFHTTAVRNIGAATVAALATPGSRILNVADPKALSVAEIGARIAAHLGWSGEIRGIEMEHPTVGQTPWSSPKPYVLDMGAAAALGYRPAAAYGDGVPAVCDWLVSAHGGDWKTAFPVLASYDIDLFDYAAEDALLTL